jgi:large subunit ribosomal protein L22
MATAFLKNYTQSPRKVRLVADTVRGKKIKDAQTILSFMPKRAAGPILKLLSSAVANAKANNESLDSLVVKEISVQKGIVAHRWMPKWRGMAHPIKKRSSHVKIVLGEGKASKKDIYKAAQALKAVEAQTESAPKKATKKAVKKVTKKSK